MELVNESKNKRIAAATTIGFHAALLIFFFFAVGWRAPNPPFGSTEGFVINLGFDDQGSGDVQPTEPIGSEQQETTPEEKQPEVTPQEEQPKEAESKPVEEQLTAKDETAVAVKDVKKEEKKEEPVKPTDKPKEKTEPVAAKEEKALVEYTKKTDGKAGQPGGEGDDVNKKGDKGQPDGQLGPGAYKGRPGGGGGGTGLDIDGWVWDEIPKVTPPDNESNGRLVFEIKVNAEGEVIKITRISSTLSIEMENKCRKEIEKLTFSKTGNNVPSISTGKITFVVLSN
jgi:periplasmic protein TonB